jgi:hypothetical protein
VSEARGEILRSSAQFLEKVEIDLIDSNDIEISLITPTNYFAQKYLKLKPDKQSILFHFFRKLTLSGVYFKYGIENIISAFNFFQLRSLKLRNCLDTNPLFNILADFLQFIRFISFELNFINQWDKQNDLKFLARFLKFFENLKNLYISFSVFGNSIDEYWESVLHHKSTLKRIIHQ